MLRLLLELIKLLPTLIPVILELLRLRKPDVDDPEPPPPDPPDPPIPPPPPPVNPKIYIPWKDREEWAKRVQFSYSVWRGDRDLSYISPQLAEEFKIDLELVKLDIKLMRELHSRQEPLRLRILNERHPDYPDRCRVRKAKANEFLAEAALLNKKYSGWIQHFVDGGVVFGVHFDSIKGYVEWRAKNEG